MGHRQHLWKCCWSRCEAQESEGGGWGRAEGVPTVLEAEGALTCWCSSGTGCWLASAPLGSLPGEGTAVETAT